MSSYSLGGPASGGVVYVRRLIGAFGALSGGLPGSLKAAFSDLHHNDHHRRQYCPSAAALRLQALPDHFMHNSPTLKTLNKDISTHRSPTSHKHASQHGHAHRHRPRAPVVPGDVQSALLGLPAESLTHITSYLDPASLFVLTGLNRRLHQHIDDDNTWRRAFAYQFLGIAPEGDIHDISSPEGALSKALMLRREESSWKREFVLRWNLRRRWERPRPSTISHIPVHSAISSIHLMPSLSLTQTAPPALLTSSLQYGIVARSYPLAGKILRGYLDAAGSLNGLGIGNPNAEFSPDITQCAMSADGGTAHVLWGFRSGAVAVTVANKAMEMSRPTAARWTRCPVDDAHEGAIEHAIWINDVPHNGGGFFATGGIDGTVKVWDAKRVVCLWTSPLPSGQLIKDPCVKIAANAHGVMTAVLDSGKLCIWSGLDKLFAEEPQQLSPSDVREIRLPALPSPSIPGPYPNATERHISHFYIHLESPTTVSLLTAYHGEPIFYRLSVDLSTGASECTVFGDVSMGGISSLRPVFAEKAGESSFIVTGDLFGFVRIYPWDGRPVSVAASETLPIGAPTSSVVAVHQFEAHGEGSVTAVAWTPTVILTGSSRGSIKAFDSLTFAPLRNFTSTSTRPTADDEVKQILVERDFFAATIHNRVVAWRGEPAGRSDHGQKGKRTAKAPYGLAKWQQQIEMYRDITESRREMDYEQEHVRGVFEREREQHASLEGLGLSEVEAVEYVLMLSREEEEARLRQEARLHQEARLRQEALSEDDAGVFADSFDEDFQSAFAGGSSDHADRPYANMFTFNGRTYPRAYHSPFSGRVHVSPRLRPEPNEAGSSSSPGSQFSLSSSLSSSRSVSSARIPGSVPVPGTDNPTHFPTMSLSSTPTRRSVSGSPESVRSAWNTPLRVTRSEGPSSPRAGGSLVSSPVPRSPGVSLLSQQLTQTHVTEPAAGSLNSNEDADLKFAIELSLAEARSRGEDV